MEGYLLVREFMVLASDTETNLICLPFAIILLIVCILMAKQSQKRKAESRQKLEEAKTMYALSLAELKQDPSNYALRMRALGLGREYHALCRGKRGIQTVDEVSIGNDLATVTGSMPEDLGLAG